MDISEAMNIIGIPPSSYFNRMASLTRKEQMDEASQMLTEARKKAKVLMAKHHPDRGGDAEKFKKVNSAMQLIESQTETFIARLNKIVAESEERNYLKTRIVLGH